MRRSLLRANIFDPKNIYNSIGNAEISQDNETMCLHLYDIQGNETGQIDISEILRLMIQLV